MVFNNISFLSLFTHWLHGSLLVSVLSLVMVRKYCSCSMDFSLQSLSLEYSPGHMGLVALQYVDLLTRIKPVSFALCDS